MAILTMLMACSSPPRDPAAGGTPVLDDKAVTAERSPTPRLSKSAARLRELTRQSREDLAARLKVDESAIVVVEARHVVWPDGSVGCPEPGFGYTQVLTEGVLVRLQAGDQIYQYHAGSAGEAFLCEKPSTSNPRSLYEEE